MAEATRQTDAIERPAVQIAARLRLAIADLQLAACGHPPYAAKLQAHNRTAVANADGKIV